MSHPLVGVLAYLGFGGYLGLGETLWNQPLNYYLLPVIVSQERYFNQEMSVMC